MLFHILEIAPNKYYVIDVNGRVYSKKPISLEKARKQIIAITISERGRNRR